MKLFFASDLHGSAPACKKTVDAYKKSGAQFLILLGDILYHGPRNDLPEGYNPKEVISVLNGIADEIIAVRGNCDSEVDSMVLNFSTEAPFVPVLCDGKKLLLTHGHLDVKTGGYDAVLSGHTHIYSVKRAGRTLFLNPGSVAFPKEGNVPTYMIYENGDFVLYDFSGSEIFREVL